jgi:hypothetical protein
VLLSAPNIFPGMTMTQSWPSDCMHNPPPQHKIGIARDVGRTAGAQAGSQWVSADMVAPGATPERTERAQVDAAALPIRFNSCADLRNWYYWLHWHCIVHSLVYHWLPQVMYRPPGSPCCNSSRAASTAYVGVFMTVCVCVWRGITVCHMVYQLDSACQFLALISYTW